MESNEWVEHFTRQMGRAIDSARGKRSDQWIADRTKAIGHPISRTAISEYRRGIRKTMPVTDWLAIAAALEVPPVSLLFPNLPNGLVSLLPNHLDVVGFDAVEWISGERQTVPRGLYLVADSNGEPLATHSRAEYYEGRVESDEPQFARSEEDPSVQVKILRLARDAGRLSENLHGQLNEFWKQLMRGAVDGGELAPMVETLQRQLERIFEQIAELGGTVETPAAVEVGEIDGEG